MRAKLLGIILLMGPLFLADTALQADEKEKIVLDQPEVVSQLNLRDDQIQKLRVLQKEKKKTLNEQQKQLRAARRQFQQALQRNANEEELKEKFKNLQTARQNLSATRFKKMLEFRALLTEEQRKQFEKSKMQNTQQQQ